MGAVLGCDASTLTRRYASVIETGRQTGKMSLKRKQWEVAMGGNVTMLIWLGKQNLGQTDKIEQRSHASVEVKESRMKDEVIAQALNLIKAKSSA
jgi:hypothetical protein